MEEERVLNPTEHIEDAPNNSLRPCKLEDFIGQDRLKNNLRTFIDSAKQRKKVLDHTIFYGPPGLGKTTLATIIANEMEGDINSTAGPLLQKVGDLAAIISTLKDGDILFIDEIHRIPRGVEELLYSAMEDYHMDIIVGEGVGARTLKIDTAKFTLVGATTRMGLLSKPLQDRFGILLNLDFYDINSLKDIILRGASKRNILIEDASGTILARSARGTPRLALRLLKRVEDFMITAKKEKIDVTVAKHALKEIEIDPIGLDRNDYKYLHYLLSNKDNPIGIDTIAAALSEHKNNIEETIEPYLIQIGFILKTTKGRKITDSAERYLQDIEEEKEAQDEGRFQRIF